MEKGWVKVQNFSQCQQKLGYLYLYLYLLTAADVARKSRLTTEFIKPKKVEYEAFFVEIKRLDTEFSIDSGSLR